MKLFKKWMVVPYDEQLLEDKKIQENEMNQILKNDETSESKKVFDYGEKFKKFLMKKDTEIDKNDKNVIKEDQDQLLNVQDTINKILEKITENNNPTPISKRTRIGLTKKVNKLSPNIKNVLEKQIKNSIKEREKEQELEREREQERKKEKSRKELFKIKKTKRKDVVPKKSKKNLEILRNIDLTPIKEPSQKGEYNWVHDDMELDETSHM
jgi:hypothetical protein